MRKKELVLAIALVAFVAALLSSRGRDFQTPLVTNDRAPSFVIQTNGRPESLEDLVVTARFSSPEPVSVGYIEGRLVSRLKLSIGRFDWRFQRNPIRPPGEFRNGLLLVELEATDKLALETQKEWTFTLSELHCKNRDMLNRLFSGCPVTASVDAMVALNGPETGFRRNGYMIETTIELPALPEMEETPEVLLEFEERRIQREAAADIKAWREQTEPLGQ